MRMKKRITATLLGAALAGGTALAVGPATAATPTGTGNPIVAPYGATYGMPNPTNLQPRRDCRWERGHWEYRSTQRGSRKVWVSGHKVCKSRRQ
jgi:hypothetical protein